MKATKWASAEVQLQAMGERLNHIRILQGKTNEDIQALSGVSIATLSRLWKGTPVKTDTLFRVLAALKDWTVLEMLIEPVTVPVIPLEPERPETPLNERQRVRKKKKKALVLNGPLFNQQ